MTQSNLSIPSVTLTTDWGKHDFYCGMLKGRLLSVSPTIKIVDITHDIPSFNTHNAAFVLRHSYSYFPQGSIHLAMINTDSSAKSRLLITEYQGHLFVLPDNGMLDLLFSSSPENVFQFAFEPSSSFASIDAFVSVVEKIYQGIAIENIGEKVEDYDKKIVLRATIDESTISGSIIYIDSYQNAITNISKSLFDRIGKGRNYNIFVQSNHNKISKLSTTYNEIDPGEILGLFNSANLLEIAIRNGYAAELLSLKIGGSVRINFY